jgi:hypothetical protein
LIGSAVVRSLVADGHRVLGLRRPGATAAGGIAWDPDTAIVDAPSLEGVDAVVQPVPDEVLRSMPSSR